MPNFYIIFSLKGMNHDETVSHIIYFSIHLSQLFGNVSTNNRVG